MGKLYDPVVGFLLLHTGETGWPCLKLLASIGRPTAACLLIESQPLVVSYPFVIWRIIVAQLSSRSGSFQPFNSLPLARSTVVSLAGSTYSLEVRVLTLKTQTPTKV
jgi:hypothetical protein